MNFKPAILIPVYRHGKACVKVVDSLKNYCKSNDVKIILVDDGNEAETKAYLNQIIEENSDFVLQVVLPKNQGKGGAFTEGLKFAQENGFTAVLQIDADGQHDSSRCEFFISEYKKNPEKLLCGYPEYDETVPSARKNGRKFANNWCRIVTWNSKIKDALCGFRLYPVEKTCNVLKRTSLDKRMGFDTDILVKLIWSGMDFEFYPIRVTYPEDGISNFRVFQDNVRISVVFTKLCLGMIIRTPILLWRKIKGK